MANLKIVADENMPAVEAMFGMVGEVVRVNGRTLQPEQLKDADILLVRSITQVNAQLLNRADHLKMVGTATIGVDHVDQAVLTARGIRFASAPGCNAAGVVEYVIAALANLLYEQGRELTDLTVGIVGVGNVGGLLAKRLSAAGIKLLLNDPPRASREPDGGFVSLQQVLQQADIVCLHTPLIKTGAWPTQHLLNTDELSMLKTDAILLNAGRGPVIDNQALQQVLAARPDLTAVLDVWEHEPSVDAALADQVAIATPHIAGYSLEGKLRGTYMLRQAAAQWFDLPDVAAFESFLPNADIQRISVSGSISLRDVTRTIYDPFADDRAMRRTLHGNDQPMAFDRLRKTYPVRREFASVVLETCDPQKAHYWQSLGFSVEIKP